MIKHNEQVVQPRSGSPHYPRSRPDKVPSLRAADKWGWPGKYWVILANKELEYIKVIRGNRRFMGW